MKIRRNQNKEVAENITRAVEDNYGYCPCKLEKTPENKCLCYDFREQIKNEEIGFCHCGLYELFDETPKEDQTTNMKVKLITYTPNPQKVVAAAAKLCYSKTDAADLYENLTPEKSEQFLSLLTSLGHFSPLEHVSFTFAIDGISRALLAQLTRHRIASYSVQSQRYVNMKDFKFIIPPEIENLAAAKEIFIRNMEQQAKEYLELNKSLIKKYMDSGMTEKDAEKKANEDARFILPNACETKIMVTMNARSLQNFFALRCCSRAQWEIRALAKEMLSLVYEVAPALFARSGPECLFGKCAEGSMCCGNSLLVKEEYRLLKSKFDIKEKF